VTVNFDYVMVQSILPVIGLLILGIIIMIVDLSIPEDQKKVLGWISAIGLGSIIIASILFGRPGSEPELVWGGMLRFDWYGFVFQMLFLFGAAITSMVAMDVRDLGKRGEFYLLLLATTLGMSFMASSANLVMLYVAIETTSIPLYILAGFLVLDKKSTESGFKYFLFGALTSTIMLFGFSLLFGFSGTTDIYSIAEKITMGESPIPIIGAMLLVLVGFGFKISVVPLHFWAPDVYEGSPTPIAGFLSTASKAAGFAVLIRFFMAVFPANQDLWSALLATLAVATMTLGNLLALTQKNIKRMLAYSSIAHAGYILIGVVVATESGFSSSIYYLIVYLVTNLAAFAVVTIIGKSIGSDEIADYAGLSRRSPGLALVLLVSLLSLAGMPPLGGFIVKFLIFASAVEANYIWLAVVGIINAIIGLYYYLIVLKVVYLYRSENDDKAITIPGAYSLTLVILTFGIILLGTFFTPWINWVMKAASSLF
jgi:NADH-quinone oxidoreductase subunit N